MEKQAASRADGQTHTSEPADGHVQRGLLTGEAIRGAHANPSRKGLKQSALNQNIWWYLMET